MRSDDTATSPNARHAAHAGREIRDRQPGMMTLIALGVSVAFVFSAAITLGYPGTPLWEELATLVTIMLLGFWLQVRSISQARGALGELATLLPNTASRVVSDPAGERVENVPIGGLRENDPRDVPRSHARRTGR